MKLKNNYMNFLKVCILLTVLFLLSCTQRKTDTNNKQVKYKILTNTEFDKEKTEIEVEPSKGVAQQNTNLKIGQTYCISVFKNPFEGNGKITILNIESGFVEYCNANDYGKDTKARFNRTVKELTKSIKNYDEMRRDGIKMNI
jgi:hypothetical protein